MDELNPTIKERQIYHEMKLTPALSTGAAGFVCSYACWVCASK